MVHGYFSSNRIGPHRLYFEIAQVLNSMGYTVVRTDLSGKGESDGVIEDIQFTDHIADLQNIIRYVLHREDLCISGRFHMLGHCIGCCTAIKACQMFFQNVESITLLSPFMPSPQNHINMLGAEVYQTIEKNGSGYRKGAYCCRTFVEAAYILTDQEVIDLLRKVHTNIVFSQEDEFAPLCDSIRWSNSIPLTSRIIESANHNYIGPEVRTKLIEHIVSLFPGDF
jgi:alpha/beta superfamily hydrolase